MSTLRTVGGAGTNSTDEKIRLVAKMLLAANEMTYLDLGRQLGLKRTPIYDRMQGRMSFTVSEVAAMADHFGVPVSVFFGGPAALLSPGGQGVTLQNLQAQAAMLAEIGQAA